MSKDTFLRDGYLRFDARADSLAWAKVAHAAGVAALQDPAKADWRCGATWFVGVDALGNDALGRCASAQGRLGPNLGGPAIDFLQECQMVPITWHSAQLSVIRPGYPQPSAEESATAFAFRRNRDAAHVDGLLPDGPERRRKIREPHAFVLGLPLNLTDPGASPMVVWQGSHRVMRAAFAEALASFPVEDWPNVDVTEAYQAARRSVFAQCPRIVMHAQPGQAYLMHRLTVHGVAPWQDGAVCPAEGRMIAYFRPETPGGLHDWLSAP